MYSYSPYKADDWSFGTGGISIIPVPDKEPKVLCPNCNPKSQMYNKKHQETKGYRLK